MIYGIKVYIYYCKLLSVSIGNIHIAAVIIPTGRHFLYFDQSILKSFFAINRNGAKALHFLL